ncbi:ATP-binding cassette domain-containing protein [Marinobacter nauticus]|uniref:thiamine ABC transporter ATP-binding protein n=1 Tax=Marinobacter nauticus TaxID=2743 RepID=UPI001C96BA00|nr:ATP-binding cassette domain-containing protein [Marinobacter nauticus]MBY5961580.1 ATP-binding cassette domain-containing protein [Marinobacter nauticus]MBY6103061.1 ATP-binding cassette domain-containing protein [Marinobacter nauticus]
MLEIKDLAFEYGPDGRLWRFDFSVPAGECLAIQGPSGSGKSTLLSLVAGFLPPASGRILWQDKPIHLLKPWQRPVTSVFQEHNLFEHLDVFTNIGLGIHPGLKLDESQRHAIEAGLERTGLAGFGPRMPGKLSGGQRQRVALLRAILRRQPLLLLDEPMTGLDTETRKILYAMLLEEKARGITMLLASHDEEERRILADSHWNL